MLINQYHRPKLVSFDTDNGFVVKKTRDVTEVLKAVKGMSELDSPKGNNYRGSVDMYTAQTWARECGAAVGTAEWKEYALKKLKDSNYAAFRADYKEKYV